MRITQKTESGSPDSQRESIEKIVQQLPDDALATLNDFAEFLAHKYPPVKAESIEIVAIPRPHKEGVIPAIKRLSKTYPMLDKRVLFDQTSAAMSAHVLNEVSSEESINRLEKVFREEYEKLIEQAESE
jgi:hypothetical protein